MNPEENIFASWTPEQISNGKKWVHTWQEAGDFMEQLRRKELRALKGNVALGMLCGSGKYLTEPRAPKPESGLVEQQRWFQKARHE